jgi:hypothetical protein
VSPVSEYVHLDSVEAPKFAVPEQRVTLQIATSYRFVSEAEIGVSVALPQSNSSLAVSRCGIVQSEQVTVSSSQAASTVYSGQRTCYVAVVLPSQAGMLQLRVHVFYSHGSGWLSSDSSSQDFGITVDNTNAFLVSSNSFNGSFTFPSKFATNESRVPGYAIISSIAVSRQDSGITFAVALKGSTSDAKVHGMLFLIGIDDTNVDSSVQDGTVDYQIRIIPDSSVATLETPDGRKLKTLLLTVRLDRYEVEGLVLNDFRYPWSFNIRALAFRLQGHCVSLGPGGAWSFQVTPQNFCATSSGGSTSVYEVLSISPAGSWDPVSLPAYLTVNVPTSITLDREVEQSSNGVVRLPVPLGTHSISIPDPVEVDPSTRLKFESWTDGNIGNDRTVSVGGDLVLNASYVRQYYLSIVSQISVPHGDGWYTEGSHASFSVNNITVPMDGAVGLLGGKWKLMGWYENGTLITSSSSGSIDMHSTHVIVAQWEPDYVIPVILVSVPIAVAAGLLLYRYRKKRKREESVTRVWD